MKRTVITPTLRYRQSGAVSIVIAMILMLMLTAAATGVLKLSGSSVIDTANHEQQISGLYIAQSGLERGQSLFSAASDPALASACSNVAGGPYTLGRGTFSLSATSLPNGCTTACTSCTIRSTATVGSSLRILERVYSIQSGAGGVAAVGGANSSDACTDNPVATPVVNPINAPAIVMTVMAYNQHIAGKPASARKCTPAPTPTAVALNSQNFESNANKTLVGVRTNLYDVAASGSVSVLQGLDNTSSLAMVSVVFPKLPGATLVDALNTYWNDEKNRTAATGTEQLGAITGTTNSGVANNTDICATPLSLGIEGTFSPSYKGDKQTCNSWCYGGDTLVLALAHGGTTNTKSVPAGGVRFNTAGTPAQNIAMIRQAHLNSTVNDNKSVYAEIWYAHNPDYLSNATASSGGVVTASIGATFTGVLTNGSASMTVTAPSGILHVGDAVSCNGGGGCPAVLSSGTTTITGQTSGTTGGAGTYTLSAACVSPNCGSRNNKAISNKLEVSAVGSGYLSVGDTISGSGVTSATITGIVGAGNIAGAYTISSAQQVASTTVTANGYTIHVTGGSVPSGGIPVGGTILAVRSGTGQFQAQSRVVATGATATQFTVVNGSGTPYPPTTRLVNAQICGGTCAFFNSPGSASSSTSFTISTGDTTEDAATHWASGFTCLSGVSPTEVETAGGSGVAVVSGWREPVQ
jgi:Tfp pilus assembly protein PilX